jgi:hypothetical protein
MGLMHLWFHQELTHLQICLDVLNTHDLLSNLLQACFESLQLEIGYPGQITDAPYEALEDAVTNSWITMVWQFAKKFGFSFDDQFTQLMPLHKEDQFLMNAFVEIGGYAGHMLFMLNTCQMFLHAIILGDISNFSCNSQQMPWRATLHTSTSQSTPGQDHHPIFHWNFGPSGRLH